MPFAAVLTQHGEQAPPAPVPQAATGPAPEPDGGESPAAIAARNLQDGTPPTPAVGPVRWGGPTTVGSTEVVAGGVTATPLVESGASGEPAPTPAAMPTGLPVAAAAEATAEGTAKAPPPPAVAATDRAAAAATTDAAPPTPPAPEPASRPATARGADIGLSTSVTRASSGGPETGAVLQRPSADAERSMGANVHRLATPPPAGAPSAVPPPPTAGAPAAAPPAAPAMSATPTPAAATATPPAPPPATPVHAVAATVQLAAARGFSHARLALNPPELGGVEVMLRSSSAGIVATVTADTPEAARLLEAGVGDLRRQLESQGIDLQRLDVDVSDRQPTDGGAAAQAGDGRRDTAARRAEAGEPRRDGSAADGAPSDRRDTRIDLGHGFLIDVVA